VGILAPNQLFSVHASSSSLSLLGFFFLARFGWLVDAPGSRCLRFDVFCCIYVWMTSWLCRHFNRAESGRKTNFPKAI
jgi:hypothetical protein